MRLSSDPNDPGYAAWRRLMRRARVLVFVDGDQQQYAVTADTKRRTVTRLAQHAAGGFDQNMQRGRVRMERVSGKVAILLQPVR